MSRDVAAIKMKDGSCFRLNYETKNFNSLSIHYPDGNVKRLGYICNTGVIILAGSKGSISNRDILKILPDMSIIGAISMSSKRFDDPKCHEAIVLKWDGWYEDRVFLCNELSEIIVSFDIYGNYNIDNFTNCAADKWNFLDLNTDRKLMDITYDDLDEILNDLWKMELGKDATPHIDFAAVAYSPVSVALGEITVNGVPLPREDLKIEEADIYRYFGFSNRTEEEAMGDKVGKVVVEYHIVGASKPIAENKEPKEEIIDSGEVLADNEHDARSKIMLDYAETLKKLAWFRIDIVAWNAKGPVVVND